MKGQEKPGLLDANGEIRDISGIVSDIDGEALSPVSIAKLKALNPLDLPVVAENRRLGPCVSNVGKFICVGLNYSDHAAESGLTVPDEPILFFKATSAICGPDDDVEIPRTSTATDWEVELGVVIGKHAKYISEADAMDHVAGYCVINDISERDFQINRSGQLVIGKSADKFGPIGPLMVTRDEVPKPQDLSMYLDVNGIRFQDGSTDTMIFSVAFVVAYITQFMSLHPGDIISTGTPPGVGMGQKPDPIYLRPGDQMELGIEGLGKQSQKVILA
jgi:ureidoglycolate lyase